MCACVTGTYIHHTFRYAHHFHANFPFKFCEKAPTDDLVNVVTADRICLFFHLRTHQQLAVLCLTVRETQ
jgi:hypothetical protein